MDWTFVRVRGTGSFQISSPAPSLFDRRAVRWLSNGTVIIFGSELAPKLVEWLEANCQGRWYDVRNRLWVASDFVTTRELELKRRKYAEEHGCSPAETPFGSPSTCEIAFELASDALLFKLTCL